MAAPATLPALLDSLTKSLTTTLDVAPRLANVELPKDGISLLDVKNELLLSYLQNLVFLILLKLRQAKGANSESNNEEQNLDDLVVSKLVELRLYLEKGARPLEDKLRFQIDKVLRAADDAERNAKAAAEAAMANGHGSDSGSGSDDDDKSGEEEDDQDGAVDGRKITDLQHRPNLAGWQRPAVAANDGRERDTSGVYRPPKIAPVVMPTTERREKGDRRQAKSATLDEFIADEMSTAPIAEPSIGTTIVNFGRKVKTASERRREDERREFEEKNFVRLPKESKKDRAKRSKQEGRSSRMNYGGRPAGSSSGMNNDVSGHGGPKSS